MKKATRIQRRLEREERERAYQIEREKMQTLYDKRFKEKQAEERVEFYKSLFKGIFWVAVFVVPVSIIVHHDNIEAEQRQKVIDAKLNTWNSYKDKNCQLVEKIFGMQMGSGKFRYVDDGNVYQCKNGVKYTISDKAAKGQMGLDSIPSIQQ